MLSKCVCSSLGTLGSIVIGAECFPPFAHFPERQGFKLIIVTF